MSGHRKQYGLPKRMSVLLIDSAFNDFFEVTYLRASAASDALGR